MRLQRLSAALSLFVLSFSLTAAHAADRVRVGVVNSASDASSFIAEAKGFLKEEGIEAEFVVFNSAGAMIAPLGSGDLDVGGGAGSVGLYNAVKRGIEIKLVAEKARSAPGFAYQAFLVRKELIDSGKFKSFADLKGKKVAMLGKGIADESVLNEAVKKGGLTLPDVERVYLGMAQQLPAFQNGAIDAAIIPEPNASQIVHAGAAVKFSSTDLFYPNSQAAGITYGGKFATERRDVAKRYMKAYIKGLRFYDAALKDGKLTGPNAAEVIDILVKYSNVKDPKVLREMSAHAVDPNGRLNLESLQKDWQFFVEQGWIDQSVTVQQVVDPTFVNEALAELGPYKRSAK